MAQTSKVSGTVQIDGAPAERTVRAYSYEAVTHNIDANTLTLSKTLGHATSDPTTGDYTIDLLAGYGDDVFVVAFDDYGVDFTADLAVSVGDRVHPTTPDGHVHECTGAGTLPSTEPTWSTDTTTAQTYGTASMIAKVFYRPMVHGPLQGKVTLTGYQHIRILITANNGGTYVGLSNAEIATQQDADITDPSMTVTESSAVAASLGGENVYNDTTDPWLSASPDYPEWVAIDLGKSEDPVEIRLLCQDLSSGPERAPKDFEIQGSTDGTTWETIAAFVGVNDWVAGVTKTFSLVV